MSAGFGARLRAQREQRQIALSTIADRMKIRLSLLEELETDRISSWPKGIFARAYLRDYARLIGLDPEPVVREFLVLHPDPPDDPFSTAEHPSNGAAAPMTLPTGLRRLLNAAMSAMPGLLPRNGHAPAQDPTPAQLVPVHTAPPEAHEPREDPPTELLPEPLTASEATRPDVPSGPLLLVREDPPAAPSGGQSDLAPQPSTDPDPAVPLTITLASPASSNGHGEINGHPPRRGRDRRRLDLSTAAELCGRLARAADGGDVTALLADASRLLDAVGTSIWLWDTDAAALRPSLAHGYSPTVLSSLPAVRPDDQNAIASAFRSGRPCIVDSAGATTGAVVVPSVGPCGCVGVLAIEVRQGSEHDKSVRAFAMILAAQLGALLPAQPN